MKNSLFVFVVVLAVSSSSLAWCESKVFQLSVTIPSMVALNVAQNRGTQPSGQLTQTQQMVRDNKTMAITSIVVP